MKYQVAILTLVVGLGVTTQQGCSGEHENAGNSSSVGLTAVTNQGGLVAFQTGFYAFTKAQNCVKCHGATTTPKFADPDINVAYDFFKTLVNPSDTSTSLIIQYAGNGHCADTPCSDPSVRPLVTSLLASWGAAVNSAPIAEGGGTPPAYLTGSLPIPTPVPAISAAPKVLRFPLAGFNFPALSKAILEVELNLYSAGEYKVSRAKIMGNTGAVTLHGIHVFVRPSTQTGIGMEDPNQGMGWVNVTGVALTSTLPATLPTTPLLATPIVTSAIGVVVHSPADVMTIGIDTIQNGGTLPPVGVRYADLVSANQALGVFTQSCVSCHSGGNPPANLNLQDYNAARGSAALIQTRMNSTTAPMPPTGLLPLAKTQVIDSWIAGGLLQ